MKAFLGINTQFHLYQHNKLGPFTDAPTEQSGNKYIQYDEALATEDPKSHGNNNKASPSVNENGSEYTSLQMNS